MGAVQANMSSGILSQARTWKRGLESLGHEITLNNVWLPPKWEEFDFILYFCLSEYVIDHIESIYDRNKNIAIAPILDPEYGVKKLKLYSKLGSKRLKITNRFHSLIRIKNKVKFILVRSEFEREYFADGLSLDFDKCRIIPLSYGLDIVDSTKTKEDFCLHISFIADERKNVKRLIAAANKYKFNLILGGKLRSQKEVIMLNQWMSDSPYVKYMGYLTDEDMIDLYQRARVFALPSLNEGVGIVALDAAAYNCDIVITKLGGPKEYYNGMAEIVNPLSVDEIGQAVMSLMNTKTHQPQLGEYIRDNNSLINVSRILESIFKERL